MNPQIEGNPWHVRLVGSHLPWKSEPIHPADIAQELCSFLLERGNLLEDVNYQKITPNHFVVEIEQDNYTRNYRPLEQRILEQWKDRLLSHITTVNSRQGRTEYRFAGPVKVELRAATDLKSSQARLLCRIGGASTQNGSGDQDQPFACLKTASGEQKWGLKNGATTIGRDPSCQVYLDFSEVQQKKLVSGLHATIYAQADRYRLFDGSPDGRPSVNGTFVNLQRVPPGGYELKDGDQILLAALRPEQPDPDLPGAVVLYFRQECS